jgi:hypothetical protein
MFSSRGHLLPNFFFIQFRLPTEFPAEYQADVQDAVIPDSLPLYSTSGRGEGKIFVVKNVNDIQKHSDVLCESANIDRIQSLYSVCLTCTPRPLWEKTLTGGNHTVFFCTCPAFVGKDVKTIRASAGR